MREVRGPRIVFLACVNGGGGRRRDARVGRENQPWERVYLHH